MSEKENFEKPDYARIKAELSAEQVPSYIIRKMLRLYRAIEELHKLCEQGRADQEEYSEKLRDLEAEIEFLKAESGME